MPYLIIGLGCILIACTVEIILLNRDNARLNAENNHLLDELLKARVEANVDTQAMHLAVLTASRELGGKVIAVEFGQGTLADYPTVGLGTCTDCGMTNTEVERINDEEFRCLHGCDTPLFVEANASDDAARATEAKGWVGLDLDCL